MEIIAPLVALFAEAGSGAAGPAAARLPQVVTGLGSDGGQARRGAAHDLQI